MEPPETWQHLKKKELPWRFEVVLQYMTGWSSKGELLSCRHVDAASFISGAYTK